MTGIVSVLLIMIFQSLAGYLTNRGILLLLIEQMNICVWLPYLYLRLTFHFTFPTNPQTRRLAPSPTDNRPETPTLLSTTQFISKHIYVNLLISYKTLHSLCPYCQYPCPGHHHFSTGSLWCSSNQLHCLYFYSKLF